MYRIFTTPFLIVFLGTFLMDGYTLAQPYFRNISNKDGLSQSSVFSIAQDNNGFMWFGTRDGLNKYDGYQFTTYHQSDKQNGLVSNDIRVLYFDKKMQNLWIGTSFGLCRFRPKFEDFVNYEYLSETHPNTHSVRAIMRDSKDRLWVGTSNGLFLYIDNEDRFIRFTAESGTPSTLSGKDVKVIHEDKNGTIWLGSEGGLDTLIDTQNSAYTFQNISQIGQLPDVHLKAILEDEKGNFWLGTHKGGVAYWDRQTNRIATYLANQEDAHAISNNNIRSMIWGKDGQIWIGTFEGLNRLNPQSRTFKPFFHDPTAPHSLSHSSVWALFLDNRKSLWVGTYFGGINFYDEANNRFSNFQHNPYKNSISNNVVSCFVEDKSGNWWIGTEGGGLNYYNPSTQKFISFKHDRNNPNSISSNNIKHLLLDGDKLWIGTFNGGLNWLDLNTMLFYQVKTTPTEGELYTTNQNAYSLTKEGSQLWIAMHGGGLNIIDLATRTTYTYANNSQDKNTLSSTLCRTIFTTKDGTKWMGTDNGLNKVIVNKKELPQLFEHYLPNKKIYTLQEDSEENLWIGTLSNGLYYLPKNDTIFKHFTLKDGLPGHSILGVLEDDKGQIWLSTNSGISKYQPSDNSFTNYNYSDGLENTEFNFNAFYKTQSGAMLFGGTKGITLFQPDAIHPTAFTPPVVFTQLKVQNQIQQPNQEGILTKALNETNHITLPYDKASFSIAFAALDYFSPSNNPFSYKLEGLDKDWITTKGKTEATYTIQNSGDYLFRLKAGNSDGVWNPKEKHLKITVLPPLWLSTPAYFLYGLVITGLGFAIFRFLQLRHRLRLEQITKEKQKELHEMKVRFFTNITHEFRTPLTLILGQLEELTQFKNSLNGNATNKLVSVKKNAGRLLNLVNQLLTFRKLETDYIQIKAEQGNIVEFTEDIVQSFQNTALDRGINLVVNSSKEEIGVWFDYDKLEKILFNLLSNAFKFSPDESEILVNIQSNLQSVTITVKDQGRGIPKALHEQIFQRFYESKVPIKRSFKGTGIGLAISKQMVELHSGNIQVESEKGHGATFIVNLPLGNQHFKPSEIVATTEEAIKPIAKLSTNNKPDFTSAKTPIPLVEASQPPKDALKLLIIEDNREVLQYIVSLFIKDYAIKTALNGKLGIKIATKFQPDLILSDIMMPEMDGIDFCTSIKKNLKTSHIPVILLTANVAQEVKIDGLAIGADDYITKPFDAKELKLRVKNLAHARINLRNKFSRILDLSPTEITVTSADEEFLKNAMDIVEKHIGNTSFGVVQFAHELAVSRPLLFTKLKAITNQTPNNFIKSIRLKRAVQLLKQKKINVSEVAYRVGFKDPRYFSKVFQKEFKRTPTQFMEQQ
ncbi:MAG: two-component regulator propeller domain-containing protein [Bacteroidota bacterium]